MVPYLRHPWEWSSFVSLMTPGNILDYLPVRDLSVWIDWTFSDNLAEITAVGKAQNFIWLTVSYFFLYRILLLLSISPVASALIASIWFLHPMHFESLQWISARKDVMAWAFMMMAAFYFIRDTRKLSEPGWKVVLLYILCIYSKATFILVAPALLVYLIFLRFFKKIEFPYKTILACGLVSTFSIFFQIWNYTSSNNMRINLPAEQKFWSMLAGFGRYLTGVVSPSAIAIDVENWGSWYLFNFHYVYAGVLLVLLFGAFTYKVAVSKRTDLGLILFFMLGVMAATPGVNWMHRSFYSIRYFEPFFVIGFVGLALWFVKKVPQQKWMAILYALMLAVSFGESANWESNGAILNKAVRHSPDNPSVLHKLLLHEFDLFLSGRMTLEEEVQLRSNFKHLVNICFDTVKTECRGIYGGAYFMAGPLGYSRDEANRFLVEGGKLQAACNRQDYPWREKSDAMFTDYVFNQRHDRLNKEAIIQFVSLYKSLPTQNLRSLNVLKVCFEEGVEKSRELTTHYLKSHLLDNLAISEVLTEFKRDSEKREAYDCYYKRKIPFETKAGS